MILSLAIPEAESSGFERIALDMRHAIRRAANLHLRSQRRRIGGDDGRLAERDGRRQKQGEPN